ASARELAPRARRFAYAPAAAVALHEAHVVEDTAGDVEAGVDLAYAAIRAAEEAHDDATRADTLARLAFILGYKRNRLAEGNEAARLAGPAVARAGNRPDVLYMLLFAEGALRFVEGDYVGSLGISVAELGVAVRANGWRSMPVSSALSDLCDDERHLGR